jgi:hypothetical protein
MGHPAPRRGRRTTTTTTAAAARRAIRHDKYRAGILKTSKPAGAPEFGVCAAVDMHYVGPGGARAAVVWRPRPSSCTCWLKRTVMLPRVPPY